MPGKKTAPKTSETVSNGLTTYNKLKDNQKCIYQAFKHVANEPETLLGNRVAAAGVDADEPKAVLVLAKFYNLFRIEAFHGSDHLSTAYSLENDTNYVMIITTHDHIRKQVRGVGDAKGIMFGEEASALLTTAPPYVMWHAIFASVDANGVTRWIDEQDIYKNGPIGATAVVAFSESII
ncbi:hypothetical protein [Rubrimonas cliftonensis]|uniref:hypothetical protein n=1 Tax=Rubrimonas cliftonensis TaxID=89524 RepID=UPI001114BFCF|nr:hypothetical protein [Rubrimonas cliftonensis]